MRPPNRRDVCDFCNEGPMKLSAPRCKEKRALGLGKTSSPRISLILADLFGFAWRLALVAWSLELGAESFISERPFSRVIPRAIVYLERPARGRIGEVHLNAAKIGIGKSFGRIVGQKILRAQFVADLAERVIELHG